MNIISLFRLVMGAALLLSLGSAPSPAADDAEKPLTAVAARAMVDKAVFVELTIKAAKNRLENRGEIYLDCEEDFRDEKNLATVITRAGAGEFAKMGIADPAEHFRGKTLRVRGTVVIKEERPRIEVNDPKQIEIVKTP